MVDDEDYEFITNCFTLKMNGSYVHGYPKRKYRGMGLRANSLQKILMLPDKLGRSIVVDHRDGNELNNQKDNLRVCTHPENMRNRKPNRTISNKEPSSKYKGVSWRKDKEAWEASIQIDNQRVSFGCYTNEIAAASVYNHYARIYHGEFARLNDLNGNEMNEAEFLTFRLSKKKTSKYIGVSLVDGYWVAQIRHEGKNIRNWKLSH